MVTVVAQYQESQDNWAIWSHVFQGQNTTWLPFDQRQIFGNFFLGLQSQNVNIWNTQIPPGSTILSASMRVSAFTNSNGGFCVPVLNAPRRSADTIQMAGIQLPFQAYRDWRPAQWMNIGLTLLSTTFSTIVQTTPGGADNTSINLNQQVGTIGPETIAWKQNAAQPFTAGAGNTDLSVGLIRMSRLAAGGASGAMRIRIQGSTNDARGLEIPDGVDVAVSSDVPFTNAPVSPAINAVSFGFPGNPSLVSGQRYVMVWETDASPDGVNYMQVRVNDVFLSTGEARFFGDGVGLDWQNYPGVVDANLAHSPGVALNVAPDTQWVIPQFIINQDYDTPDISALVQAQIDDPGYTADAGIIVSVQRQLDPNQSRIWRSNAFPGNRGPILFVTYEEPPPPVVADGMADPSLTGRHRARHEPFDLGYWRTKYGRQLTKKPASPEVQKPTSSIEEDAASLRAWIEDLAREQRQADERIQTIREVQALKISNQAAQVRLAELEEQRLQLIANTARAAERAASMEEARRLFAAFMQRKRNIEAAIAAAISFYY